MMREKEREMELWVDNIEASVKIKFNQLKNKCLDVQIVLDDFLKKSYAKVKLPDQKLIREMKNGPRTRRNGAQTTRSHHRNPRGVSRGNRTSRDNPLSPDHHRKQA
jgi:hypothetical protein